MDDEHPKSWLLALKKEDICATCPVCGGNGLVAHGFYGQANMGGQWNTNATGPEKCRTCDGKGVVWR